MFSENLRQLRENKGISQTKLGQEVGVSRDSIYRYESNLSEPNIETLKGIAKYFEVSTDYLLGFNEDLYDDNSGIDDFFERLIDNNLKIIEQYVANLSNEKKESSTHNLGQDTIKIFIEAFIHLTPKFLKVICSDKSFYKPVSYIFFRLLDLSSYSKTSLDTFRDIIEYVENKECDVLNSIFKGNDLDKEINRNSKIVKTQSEENPESQNSIEPFIYTFLPDSIQDKNKVRYIEFVTNIKDLCESEITHLTGNDNIKEKLSTILLDDKYYQK